MIHGTPRSVADLAKILADEMGVSVTYARTYMNRLPQYAGGRLEALDAQLRATAAMADLEAARSLSERDIQELAGEDDPEADLDLLVRLRSNHLLTYGSL